ncbi:acyltransferase [Pragia fontium]|uniref:Hexapeptide repeat of succinyl-transferase n=2 Tax=Pragia fontium TaxID=82985 RepID=A0AAJ4WBI1_9GAMM|nr:acyltransferase [Pragia fontium]GKX63827.1 UDP-3-O-(3-hydroxymyristoyl)glucosamine N-acyltransferase [Pragia fontium]SFD03458.1 Hexapeptide repeat of succinyl-transferase [Pragia fontium DSM 5563 = ATCC 49100]SUB83247.1 UDP-3-O-(3-hydroxymyristoyl)glucosamine N-acyltransferase [Pragia fontium]VEJ56142.1 UDP-3-O-(3-hydroxymyristoyl)glucosamine N-acyltransferase [Pragia fontium]
MKLKESGITDTQVGKNVVIYSPVNIYGCTLGDDVFIGPFVEIQKNCVVGRQSRVQSHTFICENVNIGENCFIGHNVTFANDLFTQGAPNPDASDWLHIIIEDNVSIGSGSTILAEKICSGTVIGAGSVVVKSITEKGIYAGNPARLLRKL